MLLYDIFRFLSVITDHLCYITLLTIPNVSATLGVVKNLKESEVHMMSVVVRKEIEYRIETSVCDL